MNLNDMAQEAIERLCADPEVWATHGLPPEHKLERVKEEMIRVATEWGSVVESAFSR